MKTILSLVTLLGFAALTACSGVSTIGSGDGKGGESTGEPEGMGGESVIPGKGGTSSGGKDPGMGGTSTAGKDPGMGGTTTGECTNEMDCPVDLKCETCADGGEACSKSSCIAGKCVRQEAVCSNNMKCSSPMDCPVAQGCKDCADGKQACPTADCVMGYCQNYWPTCELPPGECMSANDCGPQDGKCVLCDDGSCAMPNCVDNKCEQSCPSTGRECKLVSDCPVVGDICIKCPTTGKCAVQACVDYSCQMVCPVQ